MSKSSKNAAPKVWVVFALDPDREVQGMKVFAELDDARAYMACMWKDIFRDQLDPVIEESPTLISWTDEESINIEARLLEVE